MYPHGEFEHIVDAAKDVTPDVVFLGDMDRTVPLDAALRGLNKIVSVWWIPSNHDIDSEAVYDNLFNSNLATQNLHGRLVGVSGVKVAGLGGVFRSKIGDGWTSHSHSRATTWRFAARVTAGIEVYHSNTGPRFSHQTSLRFANCEQISFNSRGDGCTPMGARWPPIYRSNCAPSRCFTDTGIVFSAIQMGSGIQSDCENLQTTLLIVPFQSRHNARKYDILPI